MSKSNVKEAERIDAKDSRNNFKLFQTQYVEDVKKRKKQA